VAHRRLTTLRSTRSCSANSFQSFNDGRVSSQRTIKVIAEGDELRCGARSAQGAQLGGKVTCEVRWAIGEMSYRRASPLSRGDLRSHHPNRSRMEDRRPTLTAVGLETTGVGFAIGHFSPAGAS
jgi:hypothetical protein